MAIFQYRNYLLGLLTIVAAFNYLDRGVLALAMEPIRQEFNLTDSQLGFMSGFAFALFYAIAGIPIARWADRGNRNLVVSITTGLWSIMVAISGLAVNFGQLLLARVGVAIGESGCVPPAQSLISDYFDRAERPKAMAIYWMSAPLSMILAYLGGGWLVEHYGWRVTFMVVGIPGVVLALLVRLTLQEPRLNNCHKALSLSREQKSPSMWNIAVTIFEKRAFLHVTLVFCISFFFGTGIGVWIPTFFMRTHGMDPGEIGTWLAFTWGVGGMLFTFLGGTLTTRYASNREKLQMKIVAVIVALCSVFHILCYLSTNKYWALLFVSVVVGCLIPIVQAPVYAAIQSLVQERMRAVALAFIFMFSNLIGLGLGPLIVGIFSDAFSELFDEESLRYALIVFSPGYMWCAIHSWKASTTIEEDIRDVQEKAR